MYDRNFRNTKMKAEEEFKEIDEEFSTQMHVTQALAGRKKN